VVSGELIARAIADATGENVLARLAWTIAAWPVVVGATLTAFSLTYRFGPDIERDPRFLSPSAVIAMLPWLLFTVLFSLQVNDLASYQELYGALAGIATLMICIYTSCLIMLLGAEMNQVIDAAYRGEPVAAGIRGAESG
jgi:membrane protein